MARDRPTYQEANVLVWLALRAGSGWALEDCEGLLAGMVEEGWVTVTTITAPPAYWITRLGLALVGEAVH